MMHRIALPVRGDYRELTLEETARRAETTIEEAPTELITGQLQATETAQPRVRIWLEVFSWAGTSVIAVPAHNHAKDNNNAGASVACSGLHIR